ncbi:MAG: 5-demethoxyubiquinol-8 5-hydroxylase UbiM [Methylotenera sp.]|uniref:5-demethoxyubiquinol-8 5-hydroxylase UbiM n=1 Tax=Methylotenera sp. TaxID=2051956 RepID=UPI002489831A|nr:5-demethoxyubiquinol-8 5-hydroxylase UbiM [Methylotenera sp.]MDI1308363.1 5-demethoxyubiquinol-8 5-hydroxylase UbiM [Methylotenera sp.]
MATITDVVVIGAGPAGLCFAKALANLGLHTVVIERQSEHSIASPAFDGREIALTHHSAELMRELGLWAHLSPDAISPLRDARVFNGSSLLSMDIGHRDTQKAELGFLVSNHLIRKAAYEAVKSSPAISFKTEVEVTNIKTDANIAQITLSDGEIIQAKLLIGADSRFSETRRAMGIAADMHDFGKTMMVCVMEHPISHEHTAWEWFDYGQTLALLPMNGARSSVVITLSPDEMNPLMKMDEADFNSEVSARFKHRLGAMHLVSTKHAYPLVTVYSKRLIGQRFALIGDAAVGMHPVTAHGFNFGLKGIATLSAEIKSAIAASKDFASHSLLLRYEQKHRRDTRPLFLATHAIAKVYGSNSPPARLLRAGALRLGNRLAPFKRAVAGFLADAR